MSRPDAIATRIIRSTLIACLTALTLAILAFLLMDVQTFREATVNSLTSQADIIGLNSASPLLFNDPESATEILAALHSKPEIEFAAIYTLEGERFAHFARQADYPGLNSIVPIAVGDHLSGNRLKVIRTIQVKDQNVGYIALEAQIPELSNRIIRYTITGLLVFMVSGLLAAWIAMTLQRSILRPVLVLAHAAQRVSEHHDYGIRITELGSDELGMLGSTFNRMLEQIELQNAALNATHQDLERRVELRTRELADEVMNRRAAETEIRSLNQQLEERLNDLTRMNKELEAFSYSVSHDLRAPLRSIDGFSRALVEDAGPQLDDEARRYLDRICLATRRMSALIDDLLDLARIGRTPLQKVFINLSDMAANIGQQLQLSYPQRRVVFTVHPNISVTGDPALLRIMLENLLNNAWKYTANTPEPRIEFGTEQQNSSTVCFVRDNGIGFDMRYAGQLFSPFQRLHSSDQYEGTGIGLATVHRIVQRHGGSIWADAKPNGGATFYFQLPDNSP